jgi:quercetin dioxygenase-like cupin family protein
MTSTESKMQKKSLDSPDETRTFKKGKVELVNLKTVTIGRSVFEPGWSWDKCVKPIVKTNSCEAPHTSVIISGRLKVRMDDGTEAEGGPGDVAVIPPGHNAWVIGDEPCVMLDFTGAKDYAKES